MHTAKLGVIGGTGLYHIDGLTHVKTFEMNTPFGKPSDRITTGKLEGVSVAFLPRHGAGHRISPTELPSRANIYALKMLGVEYIIAINAVGSLNKNIHPGDMVIPNQYIDKTTQRRNTFFGEGLVAHISFADPVCSSLAYTLFESVEKAGARAHLGGTYVVMEGPAFSTRAESLLHRSWGADIIGMTALPEARLAREAEICYATLACVTDYDAWHETEAAVSVNVIIDTLKRNAEASKNAIRHAAASLPLRDKCGCAQALAGAIVTDPATVTAKRREEISLIVSKYLD